MPRDLLFYTNSRIDLNSMQGAHMLAVAGSDSVRQPHLTLEKQVVELIQKNI